MAASPRGVGTLGSMDEDQTAEDRDELATAQDQASEARDDRADERDERADERDERAVARERADGRSDSGAAADRAGALRDRRRGASDRSQAAADRVVASADRVLSAQEREAFAIDQLTGAHRRDPGLVTLEREMARAKRTKQPFTLAFVDVDGLKRKNDGLGHAAGDQLLRDTVDAIRAHLRAYDLIIRYGGDEFVCSLPDVTVDQAAERFALVNASLAAHQASITVGLAKLEEDDDLDDLIARADGAMYGERQER